MNRTALSLAATFTATLAAFSVVGCGGDKPPAKAPEVTTTSETPKEHAKRPVNVSDEIRGACGLPEPKEAPKFDFDNADIGPEDRAVLDQLAKCLTEGPLKGKGVVIIGRADPRGESEYNLALGAHRSGSVKKYLAGLGVGDAQMMQTSRGELDATGTDEESYRLDRRVDIELKK